MGPSFFSKRKKEQDDGKGKLCRVGISPPVRIAVAVVTGEITGRQRHDQPDQQHQASQQQYYFLRRLEVAHLLSANGLMYANLTARMIFSGQPIAKRPGGCTLSSQGLRYTTAKYKSG